MQILGRFGKGTAMVVVGKHGLFHVRHRTQLKATETDADIGCNRGRQAIDASEHLSEIDLHTMAL